MENTHLAAIISAVIVRAPLWIRHDVATNDPALRVRAEESLAAMIAAALQAGNKADRQSGNRG